MNLLRSRFWKAVYRKEPISSFILIVGAVDAVIGGVGDRATLFAFGLLLTLSAIALRWWHVQRSRTLLESGTPTRYLPDTSSQVALPALSNERQRPRR